MSARPRVALITGAGRGQGRAQALRLAGEGVDVIAVDLCADIPEIPYSMASSADLAETVAAVTSTGRRALGLTADVRDPASIAGAVDQGVAALGGLDIVVANAGVFAAGKAWEMSQETWDALLAVNLTGAWNTARASIPHLIAREAGVMVFVASIAGVKGIDNLAGYAASKHGLIGLMRTLAIELAPHQIRVNAVAPTNVSTPLLHNEVTYQLFVGEAADEGELRQAFGTVNVMPVPWIEPQDVAAAVAWLASDAARYVTGVVLPVDAGALLH
jgi:(+)-trans-carveol dehydrogenase